MYLQQPRLFGDSTGKRQISLVKDEFHCAITRGGSKPSLPFAKHPAKAKQPKVYYQMPSPAGTGDRKAVDEEQRKWQNSEGLLLNAFPSGGRGTA